MTFYEFTWRAAGIVRPWPRRCSAAAVVFARVTDALTLTEQLHMERQRAYGEIAVRGIGRSGIVVDHRETL